MDGMSSCESGQQCSDKFSVLNIISSVAELTCWLCHHCIGEQHRGLGTTSQQEIGYTARIGYNAENVNES